MNNQADSLIESGQFDTSSIHEKRQSINERYERIKNLAAHRQARLNEANTLHQFFRDIADEESWIKEKKLLVGSDDYGRDLTGVQNLKKKHKRLEAELASHEPAIQAVQEAGEKLMDVSNLGVPEIEQVGPLDVPKAKAAGCHLVSKVSSRQQICLRSGEVSKCCLRLQPV